MVRLALKSEQSFLSTIKADETGLRPDPPMIPKALNCDAVSAWTDNAHPRMSRKHSSHPVLVAGLCCT